MYVYCSDADTEHSSYRVRVGNQVKYLITKPGTFLAEVLSFLPNLIAQLLTSTAR
jgi:hypothetical protein